MDKSLDELIEKNRSRGGRGGKRGVARGRSERGERGETGERSAPRSGGPIRRGRGGRKQGPYSRVCTVARTDTHCAAWYRRCS